MPSFLHDYSVSLSDLLYFFFSLLMHVERHSEIGKEVERYRGETQYCSTTSEAFYFAGRD